MPRRVLSRPTKTHCKNGHEFTAENTGVDGEGYRCCRTCGKETKKRSYERRKNGPFIAKERLLAKLKRASQQRFLNAIRETCGCIDCGATEGYLHFDHRSEEEKLFEVSNNFTTWPRMVAEVEKCDVRCASCHQRRHVRERKANGWGQKPPTIVKPERDFSKGARARNAKLSPHERSKIARIAAEARWAKYRNEGK